MIRYILQCFFVCACFYTIQAQTPPPEFDLPPGCTFDQLFDVNFYGAEVQINGAAASSDDWIGFFDSDDNVIGVAQVTISGPGSGFIVGIANTGSGCPMGYGASVGEMITIKLYDDDGAPDNILFAANSTFSFELTPSGFVTGPDNDGSMIDVFNFVSPVPLPVELTYFRGQPKETGVLLDWATATEIDNDFFEIEHSLDGRSFTAIGQVDGVGTSDVEQRYDFMHNSPGTGLNYYRLKQVDFDGSYAYSDIETVNFFRAGDQDNEVRLFPNPAQGQVQISMPGTWEEGDVDIQIRDLNGRVLQQLRIGASPVLDIDINSLPTGLYLVELSNGQEIEIARLVKQ